MQKRGYFFIVDSIVALAVLSVGIVLLFSQHEYTPSTEQSYTLSNDILNVLSYNKIKNINNDYAGSNSNLTRDGNITDIDKTLLEQVGEFYYRNQTKDCSFCIGLIDKFLSNMTSNMIPQQYNYIIKIENLTVFNHSSSDKDSSRVVIPSKKIVHGLYNGTELYGPYLVEVLSWG